MSEFNELKLDEQMRNALGSPVAADFDGWRKRHGDAVAHLNPVVTAAYYRRRRVFMRVAGLAAAAAIVIGASVLFVGSQQSTFAQAINVINQAETMTWTIETYDRLTSEDGNRTWLRKHPRWERSWMAPGRFRDVKYDEEGNVATVDIEDVATQKVLHLNMKKKEATLKNEPSGQFGPSTPFSDVTKNLQSGSIELVGQRDVNGGKVNVFRHQRTFPHGDSGSYEYWLDAESKRLIRYVSSRGNEYFNPETTPDRNNPPEPRFKKGTIIGGIQSDIVFDAKLDPSLFSLTPPEGFTIVVPKQRPKITEEQLVEWLHVSARANGGAFVDSEWGLVRERTIEISDKAKMDRTEVEQQYEALAHKHVLDGNYLPISTFAEETAEPRSFRYLGKGVKLGTGERIVCFYKLKGAGKYRAVYGDLTVKDVDPKDLPLPVGE